MLNGNISSSCRRNMVNFSRRNMVNFSQLTAEICWRVWGTPANFNQFHILTSLLHSRRSTEVNKTLQDVWPSTGLVHYIYVFGGFGPLTVFCQLQNSLCVQVLRSPILPALLHSIRSAAISQTLWRGTRNGIMELSQRAPPTGWRRINWTIYFCCPSSAFLQ